MTSWTEKQKTPLLPPSAQEFLTRRGAELIGLGFALVGLGAELRCERYALNGLAPD